MSTLTRAVGAALALAAMSGCASTVQVSGTASVGTTGDAAGATGGTTGGGTTGVSSTTGTGVALPGAPTGPGGTTGRAPGAAPSASTHLPGRPATSTAIPAKGRGWDDKHVYIGVVTQKDTQRVFASFGADNVDPGDTEQQAQAVADGINAAGGINGRQVRLRFRDIAILETNANPDSVGQAVCAHFTQDAPVVAVWNVSTQIDQAPTFRNCLAKAGVPLFTTAARAIDDKLMSELAPYYYHALVVSWTRLAPVLVGRLKAQGYFQGWNTALGRAGTAKVVLGLLVEDEPQGKRTAEALRGALAAAGHRDVVTFSYDDPAKGQTSSVQYFKGNGVTHVIVADVELTAFQNSAQSQAYYPRYGITTYNDPYSNLETSSFTPTGANNGAMGVGWAPTMDVSEANDPGATPGWPRCKKLMAKRGQAFGAKRLAQAYASMMCDALFLIDAGAEAGRGFSGTAIRSGILGVGPRFSLALGFAPALGASTPFTAGVVRDLAWHADCSCMRYGAKRTALPR